MKKYIVILEISESGKACKIQASNGRIIAEMLVEGPLDECVRNAVNNAPIVKGRANIFRGELIRLDKNERLNLLDESIKEI